MEIQVDGNRSTSDSWLEANRIPLQSLPVLTPDEQTVANKLAIPYEAFSRSKVAAEITRQQLQNRASRLGLLVETWLQKQKVNANVTAVWLKTFEGKFRIDVQMGNIVENVFITEELVDDLFDSGSREAEQRMDRLLSVNLLPYAVRAS